MSHVFLILVFGVNGGTINTTTPMPDMDTCKRMEIYHKSTLPRDTGWTTAGISEPTFTDCVTM